MQVAIVEDEQREEGEMEQCDEVEGEHETGDREYGMMELPLYSISGMTQPQTMKMRGRIQNEEAVVMIDSGVSHNFISRMLVEKLGRKIDETVKFGVCLGDGTKVQCQALCPGLEIQLGAYTAQITGHLFELGGVDIILGVEWLRTLGEVRLDWNKMRMRFKAEGQLVELTGDPTLQRSMLSLKSIGKVTEIEFAATILTVERATAEDWGTTTKGCPRIIQEVLTKFRVVLDKPHGLPPRRNHDHAIIIKEGQGPISVRPYSHAHRQKNEIEKLVAEMLSAGIIQPSLSPYSSPVILVKKKDGSWRFCVDYRALNEVTVSDKYPIRVVEELLDELHGSVWFSKLDLRAGYHQIRVRPGDVEKTAFRTHLGHYEFLVMPFGLKNAPATFQSTMNDILRPHLRKFVLVFFDDILIYSRNLAEHVTHLQIVLQVLQDNQLFVNEKKCGFGLQEIEYLGHVVSGTGVAVDKKKVESVEAWPIPTNIKGLRGFLGLSGYYRKFIRDYGKVAKPLTELLKKGSFAWNNEANAAFEELKHRLTTAPVLKLPNFEEEFVVECDASGRGIGAVLAQGGRPIAFYSKALAERALGKSTYEKELMALVLAVRHWRPYLLDRRFLVLTNHKSLKELLHQRITTPDQQPWLSKLLGYEFQIKYKAGTLNGAADALSRCVETAMNSISIPQWQDMQEIKTAVKRDPTLIEIMAKLEKGELANSAYTLSRGLLWHKIEWCYPVTRNGPTEL
ncbi:peroxidase 64 [Dorcoceras hygrometricum]|uniref:Peroxidase 64 n=1 Tax=Dorcoceras hygrometricum TaxID=472368 RepID=A0A2Z7DDG0_9LAMI|nr:peroxidase 64 [Dorcoceras hygrometricum]